MGNRPGHRLRTWVDRFDTGLVDITGDHGLLAQINGRHVDWIDAQTSEFHAGIVDPRHG